MIKAAKIMYGLICAVLIAFTFGCSPDNASGQTTMSASTYKSEVIKRLDKLSDDINAKIKEYNSASDEIEAKHTAFEMFSETTKVAQSIADLKAPGKYSDQSLALYNTLSDAAKLFGEASQAKTIDDATNIAGKAIDQVNRASDIASNLK